MSSNENDIINELLNDISKDEHGSGKTEYLKKFHEFFDNTDNRYDMPSVFKQLVKISEKRGLDVLFRNITDIKKSNHTSNDYKTPHTPFYKTERLLDLILLEIERCNQFGLPDDREIFGNYINKKNKDINEVLKETKQIKTELTAILGVFTAIVIGFVGQMIFSSSVLSNMKHVNPYELAFVISALTFGFINLICILVFFIYKIIFKNNHNSNIEANTDNTKMNDSANKENSDTDNTNSTNKLQIEKPVDDDLKSLKGAWHCLNFFTAVIAIITFVMWVKTN